jgi:hypothetical protein
LKKALYGLKQAPRAWYGRIDGFLMKLGFIKSDADSNLYYKVVEGDTLILVLYVDDLFLTGDDRLVSWCKKQLSAEFEMKDLGLMHYFLGLEIWQKPDATLVSQGNYTVDILRRFGMMDSKSMSTLMTTNLKKLCSDDSDLVDPTMYRQLIGSLMYLVNTRPDICFVVSTLSQCMCEPRQTHWVAAKHVFRYLRGTVGYGLRYTADSDMQLVGYTDLDWASSIEDRKSTSGCCFSLGFAGICNLSVIQIRIGQVALRTERVLLGCCFSLGSVVISWFSRNQTSVALSSAEAEYIAACMAAREVVWLRKLLAGLFGHMVEPTVIRCDNQSCVQMSMNPVHHDTMKHVEMRYHYVRDMVQRRVVELQFVPTDEQVADVLTKSLVRGKFEGFWKMLEIVDDVSLAEREC